ncbi:hypothetical protein Hanom_Chr16g01469071 [Helianthus anomalus]
MGHPLCLDGSTEPEKVLEVSNVESEFVKLHRTTIVGRTRNLNTLIYFDLLLRIRKDIVGDLDLTTKCVGVLAGNESRIKEFLNLKWKGKQFRVLVSEEDNEWIPDCLGPPEAMSSENGGEVSDKENVSLGNVKSGGHAESYDGSDTNSVAFLSNEALNGGGNTPTGDTSETGADKNIISPKGIYNFGAEGKENNKKKGFNNGLRRFKRRKGKTQNRSVGSPSDSRPSKRMRAQLEEEDIFGLDDILKYGPYDFQCPRMDNNGDARAQQEEVGAAGSGAQSQDLNRRTFFSSGHVDSQLNQEINEHE